MFAIAVPQTIPLTTPGEDGQPISLTFHTGTKDNPDDVATSTIDVLMPNGDVHVATFNTRGGLQGVEFIEYHEPDSTEGETDGEEVEDAGEAGADYKAGAGSEKESA